MKFLFLIPLFMLAREIQYFTSKSFKIYWLKINQMQKKSLQILKKINFSEMIELWFIFRKKSSNLPNEKNFFFSNFSFCISLKVLLQKKKPNTNQSYPPPNYQKLFCIVIERISDCFVIWLLAVFRIFDCVI